MGGIHVRKWKFWMNLTQPIGWKHYECGLFTFAKKSQKQIRGRQNHFQEIDAQKFQINRWLLAWMAACPAARTVW